MKVPLETIFSWFEKGDMPTENQFQQTFSSFRHLDENIRMDEITGLNDYIKQNREQIELLKGSGANFSFGGILRPTDHIIIEPGSAKWFWAGSGVYENASGVTVENFGIISFDGFVWSVLEIGMPGGGEGGFVDLTQED
jgi:hypothetical protein